MGRDIVVPFLEKASPATSGVLEPAGYEFDLTQVAARKYPIYDLELKTSASHAVEVRVPAGLPDATRTSLHRGLSRKVFEVLQVRDLGRIDYRVRDDGSVCFLEINALPSLETGAALYRCAALAGARRRRRPCSTASCAAPPTATGSTTAPRAARARSARRASA